jgi:hypothetical protein
MAVGEDGDVYGLMAQKQWVRPPEDFGQSEAKRKKMPIEEKESYKWLEALDGVGASFPDGTMAVHVCDREADIYELFCKAARDGTWLLCRRFHNRSIEEADGFRKLDALVDAQPEAGRIVVHVPRDSHTKRKARDAELAVRYGKCTITKPPLLVGTGDIPKSIELYYVTATEIDPPEGQEKICWKLIANVPTESFEDAVTRIQWYTQRWKIETFHRTLKGGCAVEKLQYESADKLMKLVAIYSIIALEIMHLGYIARTRPDETCEIILTEEEWTVLYRVANKTKKLPDKAPTVREAVAMIAKLGGFLGRKSDGFPGVTVIWRGMTRFYAIMDAVPFLS